jgi:hypothetical protein
MKLPVVLPSMTAKMTCSLLSSDDTQFQLFACIRMKKILLEHDRLSNINHKPPLSPNMKLAISTEYRGKIIQLRNESSVIKCHMFTFYNF